MDDVNKTQKTLILMPNYLGIKRPNAWIPDYYNGFMDGVDLIFCENYRIADRLLDSQKLPEIELYEINEHTNWQKQESEIMALMLNKNKIGVLSDAGLPCVADPGERIVSIAHSLGFKIELLPGSNAMILALAASGFNGQKFSFNGYIAIEQNKQNQEIKKMLNRNKESNETQIFMETPYRNIKLLQNLMNTLPKTQFLCIAADLLGEGSFVKSQSIEQWKEFCANERNLALIGKKPAVFLLGTPSY